jgi:hypothetical protein
MEVCIERPAEPVDEGHRPKRAFARAPGLWALSRFSIACKDPQHRPDERRVIDGIFSAEAEAVHFHEATVLSDEDTAAVQRNVRNRGLFARCGLITPEAAAEMRQWTMAEAFRSMPAVRIEATDQKD